MDRTALGRHLRSTRQEHGLSLNDVASATDISTSFLSQVEKGESDITISRLVRIADFLGIELTQLIRASRSDEGTVEIFRGQSGEVIESPDEGIVARILGRPTWVLQPSIDIYRPGGSFGIDAGRSAVHSRECFVYVVEGEFELRVGDRAGERLKAGEAALFRGAGRGIENVGKDDGCLIAVTVPLPGRDGGDRR
jgi:transcriptional regulator with XRE-family HTH domain